MTDEAIVFLNHARRPRMATAASPPFAQSARSALSRHFAEERDSLWRTDRLMASAGGNLAFDDRLPSVTPGALATLLRSSAADAMLAGSAMAVRARRPSLLRDGAAVANRSMLV